MTTKKEKIEIMTIKELKRKRKILLENISDWDRTISMARSSLIQLCLIHYIKNAREELSLIEEEIAVREK